MVVKAIIEYFDRETGEHNAIGREREVTDERGLELIEKGVAIEVKKETNIVEDLVADESVEENKEVVKDETVKVEEEAKTEPKTVKRTPKSK